MAQITKTCLNICEIDSQYPDSTETGSCDVGYYSGPKINNCFFNFDAVNDEIPAGSNIDSAYLKLYQVTGGYSLTENIDITLRSGSWYVMTWNNQAPNAGAGTVDVTLTGTTAGLRTFNVTSLVQWIVDNNSSAHIFKLARDPNYASGSYDAKRFSTTPGNHSLEINYTPPPTYVDSSVSTEWHVYQSLEAGFSAGWHVFSPVESGASLAWHVAESVEQGFTSQWHVVGAAEAGVAIAWDIESQLLTLESSLSIYWGVGAYMETEATIAWGAESRSTPAIVRPFITVGKNVLMELSVKEA